MRERNWCEKHWIQHSTCFSPRIYGSAPEGRTCFINVIEPAHTLDSLSSCSNPSGASTMWYLFLQPLLAGSMSYRESTWTTFELKGQAARLEAQQHEAYCFTCVGMKLFLKKGNKLSYVLFLFVVPCLEFVAFSWFQPHIGQMSSGTSFQQLSDPFPLPELMLWRLTSCEWHLAHFPLNTVLCIFLYWSSSVTSSPRNTDLRDPPAIYA